MTKTKVEHSPTPWEIHPEDKTVVRVPYGEKRGVLREGGEGVAWCEQDDAEQNKANAAFIVKCVNNHELLLEAVKDLLTMIGGSKNLSITEQQFIANAKAALKAAGE